MYIEKVICCDKGGLIVFPSEIKIFLLCYLTVIGNIACIVLSDVPPASLYLP